MASDARSLAHSVALWLGEAGQAGARCGGRRLDLNPGTGAALWVERRRLLPGRPALRRGGGGGGRAGRLRQEEAEFGRLRELEGSDVGSSLPLHRSFSVILLSSLGGGVGGVRDAVGGGLGAGGAEVSWRRSSGWRRSWDLVRQWFLVFLGGGVKYL